MSFLVIAGSTVPVAPSGASENAPEQIGSTSRAYDGSLRSTVRAEKRSWTFTTKPIDSTLEATIRAAVANAYAVTVTGSALGGASVTCIVTLGQASFTLVRGGFKKTLTLNVKEV